jgi:protein-S-isoprenylcysteine O-methyltransferase Ste14
MTDTTLYITLLVVSVALTFAVGRLLVTAGEPFLQEVFEDRSVTRSVNLLLSVLFHLVTLGVLAIISVIDLRFDSLVQTFVVRLGVVLLVLGLAYGISMLVLIQVRERRRAAQISEHVQERLAERGVGGTAAAPPVIPAAVQPAPPMGSPIRPSTPGQP